MIIDTRNEKVVRTELYVRLSSVECDKLKGKQLKRFIVGSVITDITSQQDIDKVDIEDVTYDENFEDDFIDGTYIYWLCI